MDLNKTQNNYTRYVSKDVKTYTKLTLVGRDVVLASYLVYIHTHNPDYIPNTCFFTKTLCIACVIQTSSSNRYYASLDLVSLSNILLSLLRKEPCEQYKISFP